MKKLACMLLALFLLLPGGAARAAESQAVKVLGTNGTVTVGVRGGGPVYTTDGVHWQAGEAVDGVAFSPFRGCWDGERFLAWAGTTGNPAWCSTDGVRWSAWSGGAVRSFPRGAAELGPYRFELEGNDLWLMDETGRGLVLPAVREACQYMAPGDVQAYYGPEQSVIVEVYDQWDLDGSGKQVFPYAVSSLDWCMEHLAQPRMPRADNVYRQTVYTAGNGVILCRAQVGTLGTEYWTSTDGQSWTPILDGAWNGDQYGTRLHEFNGKTFVIQDLYSGTLYASEDGTAWREIDSPILERRAPGDAEYAFAWTGSGYLARACRIGTTAHEPTLHYSGPYLSQILFLDAEFQPTGTAHDFGARVMGISVADGVCYARVLDSESVDQYGETEEESTIYASRDQANWEKTELYELPYQLPAGARVARPWLQLAEPYYLELGADGVLWISLDGVNYGSLGPYPDAEHVQMSGFIKGYAGRDGLLVRGADFYAGHGSAYNRSIYALPNEVGYNGTLKSYTKAQIDAALANPAALTETDVQTVEGGGAQVRRTQLERWEDGALQRELALYTWSGDGGATWEPIHFDGADTWEFLSLVPYNGRSFMMSDYNGTYLVSEDGLHWRNLPTDWRGAQYGPGYFLWTGSGYMVRQETYSGGHMFIPAETSEKSMQILFLDEDFRITGSHSFGGQVTGMAWKDGVYYAQTSDGSIYLSRDRSYWTPSVGPMPQGSV